MPKPRIFYSIPFDSGKDLAKYYNSFMSLLDDNDYACFIDADACFTTYTYGKQIEEIIEANPEYDLWTGLTNRIGTPWQRVVTQDTNDIEYHRLVGSIIQKDHYNEVEDVTNRSPISGFFFIVKKSAWVDIDRGGMLGIDNQIHYNVRNNGGKVGQMKGLYCYHYYSNFNGKGKRNKDHLYK